MWAVVDPDTTHLCLLVLVDMHSLVLKCIVLSVCDSCYYTLEMIKCALTVHPYMIVHLRLNLIWMGL